MLVFLDFDGVLNTEKDIEPYDASGCVILPAKVAKLNRIPAALPEVRFVLPQPPAACADESEGWPD